jgi:hypothetical protein
MVAWGFPRGMLPRVKRLVLLFATLVAIVVFVVPFAQTPTGTRASFDVTELELAIRQPDGATFGAHFLVAAENEKDAFGAALSTVNRLFPGATVHELDPYHQDHPTGDDMAVVRAQWAPWGWRWLDHEVPVSIYYNPQGALAHFAVADVLQALEIWSSVPSSSFAYDYRGETTLLASMNVDGPDGSNVIAWQDLGCDAGCVLGLTTKSFESHEVDISLNSNPGARLGDGSGDTFDVLTVLIHELGHMAGLEHSCPPLGPCTEAERDAVMFYSYQGIAHELGVDDIAGLSNIYPASHSATSSVSGPPTEAGQQAPMPPVERSVTSSTSSDAFNIDLYTGWNLVLLPAMQPGEIAAILGCVEAIYAYDEVQGWSHWIDGLYSVLQTLDRIQADEVHWVLASRDCGAFFH